MNDDKIRDFEFISAMDDEDDGFGSRPDSANKSSVCNLLWKIKFANYLSVILLK